MSKKKKIWHPVLFELYVPVRSDWFYTNSVGKHYLSPDDIIMPIRIEKTATLRGNNIVTIYVFGADKQIDMTFGEGSTWQYYINDNLLSLQP